MRKKMRVTRNREADELWAYIQDDAAMMSALEAAVREFWTRYKALFAAAGSGHDPSALLLPPTADLIFALLERKLKALRAVPQIEGEAEELPTPSTTAT